MPGVLADALHRLAPQRIQIAALRGQKFARQRQFAVQPGKRASSASDSRFSAAAASA
jgi:hypothetical protein